MRRRQVLAAAALGLLPGCTAGAGAGAGGLPPAPDPWPGVAFSHEPEGPVRGVDVAPDGRVALLSADDESIRTVLTVFDPRGRVLTRESVEVILHERSQFVQVRLWGNRVMVQGRRLAVFDADDGSVAWTGRLFHLPHLVADGVAYGRGRHGLYAAAIEDGSVGWSRPVLDDEDGGGFGWPVGVVENRLIVVGGSADRGFVQAREPGNGRLVWHVDVPGEFPSVAMAGETLYVGTNDATPGGPAAVVAAIDPGPGLVQWRRPFPDAAFTQPVVGPAGLAVDLLRHNSLDRTAVALTDHGEVRWRAPDVEVAAVGDRLYGLDERNRLVTFASDGDIEWRRDVLGRAPTSGYNGIGGTDVVAVEGGALGVTADRVALVSPEGTVRWHIDPPATIRGYRLPASRWTLGGTLASSAGGVRAVAATRRRLYALGG